MLTDALDVKQLLAPWDYTSDAVQTYGRALKSAMASEIFNC